MRLAVVYFEMALQSATRDQQHINGEAYPLTSRVLPTLPLVGTLDIVGLP